MILNEEQNMFLFHRLEDIPFSIRTQTRLKELDIIYIGDLVHTSDNELLKGKNFGPISLNEIKDYLTPKGLRLGMNVLNWKARQEILYFSDKIRTVLWATPPNKLDKILDTLKDIVYQTGEYSMEETK